MAAAIPNATDRQQFGSSFSNDQWAAVMDMFRGLNPASAPSDASYGMSPLPWILDTGASFHMTGDRSILQNMHTIPTVSVVLLDGDLTSAATAGTALFGSTRLPDVLHIPALTCNLLSLAKLTRHLSCLDILSPKFCVLQIGRAHV